MSFSGKIPRKNISTANTANKIKDIIRTIKFLLRTIKFICSKFWLIQIYIRLYADYRLLYNYKP